MIQKNTMSEYYAEWKKNYAQNVYTPLLHLDETVE